MAAVSAAQSERHPRALLRPAAGADSGATAEGAGVADGASVRSDDAVRDTRDGASDAPSTAPFRGRNVGSEPGSEVASSSATKRDGCCSDCDDATGSGIPLPPWAADLPGPLPWLLRTFHYSLRRRDDTLLLQMRKVGLTAYALLSVVATLNLLALLPQILTRTVLSTPSIAFAAGNAVLPFAYFGGFAVAKVWPDYTALAADVPLTVNLLYNAVIAVARPNSLMGFSALRALFGFLLVGSPRAPAAALVAAAVYWVAAYNDAVLVAAAVYPNGVPGGLAATPDAELDDAFGARITNHAVGFIAYVALYMFLRKLQTVAEQHEDAARASQALAASVATALSAYDTADAREQIAVARERGVANPALLGRFGTIVDNLEQYRPHLPNWLLPAATRGIADVATHDKRDAGFTPHQATPPGNAMPAPDGDSAATAAATTQPRGAFAVNVADTASQRSTGSTAGSRHRKASRRSSAAHQQQHHHADAYRSVPGAADTVLRANDRSLQLRSPGLSPTAPDAPAPGFGPRPALNTVHAVLGHVGFRVPRAASLRRRSQRDSSQPQAPMDAAEAAAAIAAATNAFVDRVHALAGATGAAVHSFVGDTAAVTWGAVTAVAAQPEAQAARFMARLRQDAGHALVTAWGALAAGNARVQLAGAAGPQRAVTVSVEFAEAAERLLALARRHRAFVCDGAVHDGARHAVELRGIGVVRIDADAFDDDAAVGSAPLSPAGSLLPAPNSPAGPGGNESAYAGRSASLERSGRKATAPAALPVFEILRERHHQAGGNTDGAADHGARAGDECLCTLAVAVAEGDRDSALRALAALAAAGFTTDVLARDAMLTELVHEAASLVPAV